MSCSDIVDSFIFISPCSSHKSSHQHTRVNFSKPLAALEAKQLLNLLPSELWPRYGTAFNFAAGFVYLHQMTQKNCPRSTQHCYSWLISSACSMTTTLREDIAALLETQQHCWKYQLMLWVMSLLHHMALPSGVHPAVGCRMPVRTQARTPWEAAVVWGGVAVTSVPSHSAPCHVLRPLGSPDVVTSSLPASLLSKPSCRDLSPQDSLQLSLLSPNSKVISSHLTSQFKL